MQLLVKMEIWSQLYMVHFFQVWAYLGLYSLELLSFGTYMSHIVQFQDFWSAEAFYGDFICYSAPIASGQDICVLSFELKMKLKSSYSQNQTKFFIDEYQLNFVVNSYLFIMIDEDFLSAGVFISSLERKFPYFSFKVIVRNL